jgi:succinate dehydrogenase/fumarate reductase cytochrome b subunit (b558 family)
MNAARRSFLLRRLHALTGVFPVGVFLVVHLWTNAKGLGGQAAFDKAVRDIHRLPLLPLIEIFGIFLPLSFHALYGVKLALVGRPNVVRYPFSRNWLYTMQRATGLLAFAFILYHLWEFRIAKLLGRMGTEAFYPTLAANLSSTLRGVPVVALVYLVGITASVIHFANGLFTVAFSWGLCVSRRSQRLFFAASSAIGLVVLGIGVSTAIYFATGVRWGGFLQSHSSVTEPRCSVVDRASVSLPKPARPAGPITP